MLVCGQWEKWGRGSNYRGGRDGRGIKKTNKRLSSIRHEKSSFQLLVRESSRCTVLYRLLMLPLDASQNFKANP